MQFIVRMPGILFVSRGWTVDVGGIGEVWTNELSSNKHSMAESSPSSIAK